MRAAVMRHKQLVVDTVASPEPEVGQVLVRTLACGICGSDLHALRHADRLVELTRRSGLPSTMDPSRDVVMGHEFCAEIVAHGPETAGTLKTGTRVCSIPLTLTPRGIEQIGYSNRVPGGYGELMTLSEMMLLEVPNGLSAEHAALTEPMAVGVHAVAMARLTGDEVPIVIGCGPVGLAVIAALGLASAAPVVAADFSPARRALAERLGAHVVVDPAQRSPYASWRELAAPPGYDPGDPFALLGLGPHPRPCVVFECVGVPGILQQILEGAPRHARVVVAGVCMERDQVEPFLGVGKELAVQFVFGYTPEEFAATLRHIAEGTLDVAPLVTGTVSIDGVPQAFADLAHPEHHAKILVTP